MRSIPKGILGFTGTSKKDMASRQLKAVRQLLYHVNWLHLGDCIHADAQAHAEAINLGVMTHGHPPIHSGRRAMLEYDKIEQPKDFLLRNRDIVMGGVDGLIAAPSGWVEVLRSGTWATVRYARSANRHIWIVRPDGSIREEGA